METIFGLLEETNYPVHTNGVASTFGQGTVYRHPGMISMVDLAGTHQEMGLQYGVLLKPELLEALSLMEKVIQLKAATMGIDSQMLLMAARMKAEEIAQKVPERFIAELQGISEGSGIPYSVILTLSLIYDVGQAMGGCTSILMRGENGALIHGRHNDSATFLGEAFPSLAVIVRYNPTGYYSVTHMDVLFWTGVETGFNDQGLSFSEETLHPQTINQEGGSLVYFVRDALERSDCLGTVEQILKETPLIGGYGMVWGDNKNCSGALFEAAGDLYQVKPWEGPILYHFNKYYSYKLSPLEDPRRRINGYVTDREEIAATYGVKETYSLDEAIDFLRMTQNTTGDDYAWLGTKTSICNKHTQQTMFFDSSKSGFYYALAPNFAGCSDIYFYFSDFSKAPVLYRKKSEINCLAAEDALIENLLIGPEEKLAKRVDLADRYPQDANAQFLVALGNLQNQNAEVFITYAEKAYALKPEVAEYALYAGIAAYFQRDNQKAMKILTAVDNQSLTQEQLLILHTLLQECTKQQGKENTESATIITEIINAHGVQDHYNNVILPFLNPASAKI